MLRTLARGVVKKRMKKQGYAQICKGNPSFSQGIGERFLNRRKARV